MSHLYVQNDGKYIMDNSHQKCHDLSLWLVTKVGQNKEETNWE